MHAAVWFLLRYLFRSCFAMRGRDLCVDRRLRVRCELFSASSPQTSHVGSKSPGNMLGKTAAALLVSLLATRAAALPAAEVAAAPRRRGRGAPRRRGRGTPPATRRSPPPRSQMPPLMPSPRSD